MSNQPHVATRRPLWPGLAMAALGAVLLVIGLLDSLTVLIVLGAGLLATGAAVSVSVAVTTQEDRDSEDDTLPGMIGDPEVKRQSSGLDRQRLGLERATHEAPRGPMAPLGGFVMLAVSVFLLVAQWTIYPLGRTAQDNALHSLLAAVVLGLAGLRILVAQPARHLVSSLLALLAGAALLLSAFLADHETTDTAVVEGVCGGFAVIAAAVALVSPLGRGRTRD
jgi:hypothetical protein